MTILTVSWVTVDGHDPRRNRKHLFLSHGEPNVPNDDTSGCLVDTAYVSNHSTVAGSFNRSSEISIGVGADSHSSDTHIVPYSPTTEPPIPTDQNEDNLPPL